MKRFSTILPVVGVADADPRARRTGSATPSTGFTLLELVLVMLVICIALAIAAPSLSNWSKGSAVRDAGTQFAAVTLWARTEAISTGAIHRLNLDRATGKYWITKQQGEGFVAIDAEFGRPLELPDGCAIELTGMDVPRDTIDFYPNGRTQPCKVRIVSGRGTVVEIESPSPAEPFHVLAAGGNQ